MGAGEGVERGLSALLASGMEDSAGLAVLGEGPDDVGPPPKFLRFIFTDPSMASKYGKGLAIPLGINRAKVATTLRSVCNGAINGTCYGSLIEAQKPDVLGVDLEAILEHLEDSAWAKRGGGKLLKEHGFVVNDGELQIVFQHYSSTAQMQGGEDGANMHLASVPILGTKRKKPDTEEPPFSSIELEYLNIAFRHWPRDLATGAPLTKTGGNNLPPAPECYRKFCIQAYFKLLKENKLDRRQSSSKIKSFFGTKASTEAAWLLGPARKKPPPSDNVRERAKLSARIWSEAYGAAFLEKRIPPMVDLSRDEQLMDPTPMGSGMPGEDTLKLTEAHL